MLWQCQTGEAPVDLSGEGHPAIWRNLGVSHDRLTAVVARQLNQGPVVFVEEAFLDTPVAEGVDPVVAGVEAHPGEAAAEPVEELGLLDGDELPVRSRDEEDGNIRLDVLGAVHPRKVHEGADRTKPRIGRSSQRDFVLTFTILNGFGVSDGDENTVVDLFHVAPFQDISAVVVVAIFRDHVRASKHGLEENEGESSEGSECLVLDEAKGGEIGNAEEFDKDCGGDGGHLFHLVLELALEATHDLTKWTKGGGSSAVQPQPAMESPDSAQIHLDAFGCLQSANNVKPDGEKAQFFAGEGEGTDVGQLSKSLEGFGLGSEGAASPRSPGVSHNILHVRLEELDQT